MPTAWGEYRARRKTCRRPYRWSQMRGGCRFEPGHRGDCKPASRSARYRAR